MENALLIYPNHNKIEEPYFKIFLFFDKAEVNT